MSKRNFKGLGKALRGVGAPVEAPKPPPPIRESMRYMAENDAKYGRELCDKFAEKFKDDPAYALEWSVEAFAAAARLRVGETVVKWLDATDPVIPTAVIMAEVERMVIRTARWPASSTSPASNHMALILGSKWAEFYEAFRERFAKENANTDATVGG